MELFKVVDGLIGEQVKPYFGDPPKGGREHLALCSIDSFIKVKRGLEARDVVVEVGHPLIPLARNL